VLDPRRRVAEFDRTVGWLSPTALSSGRTGRAWPTLPTKGHRSAWSVSWWSAAEGSRY